MPTQARSVRRQVVPAVLSAEECEELAFIHNAFAACGYRPHVTSLTLHDLLRVKPELVMPLVKARHKMWSAVETALNMDLELYPEFTALIGWGMGASLGWHTDNNREYLSQRHVSAVCYLNTGGGLDFEGGDFMFRQMDQPAHLRAAKDQSTKEPSTLSAVMVQSVTQPPADLARNETTQDPVASSAVMVQSMQQPLVRSRDCMYRQPMQKPSQAIAAMAQSMQQPPVTSGDCMFRQSTQEPSAACAGRDQPRKEPSTAAAARGQHTDMIQASMACVQPKEQSPASTTIGRMGAEHLMDKPTASSSIGKPETMEPASSASAAKAQSTQPLTGSSGEHYSILRVTPTTGTLVCFMADEEHAVQAVQGGYRLTLTMWFTRSAEASEDKQVIPQLASLLPPCHGLATVCLAGLPDTMYLSPHAAGQDVRAMRLHALGFKQEMLEKAGIMASSQKVECIDMEHSSVQHDMASVQHERCIDMGHDSMVRGNDQHERCVNMGQDSMVCGDDKEQAEAHRLKKRPRAGEQDEGGREQLSMEHTDDQAEQRSMQVQQGTGRLLRPLQDTDLSGCNAGSVSCGTVSSEAARCAGLHCLQSKGDLATDSAFGESAQYAEVPRLHGTKHLARDITLDEGLKAWVLQAADLQDASLRAHFAVLCTHTDKSSMNEHARHGDVPHVCFNTDDMTGHLLHGDVQQCTCMCSSSLGGACKMCLRLVNYLSKQHSEMRRCAPQWLALGLLVADGHAV